MANYQTHIATSSAVGAGLGAFGYLGLGYPPATCILAGGFCGIAGMLPDVDSDNGVPLREVTSFLAAVVPLMAMNRFDGEVLGGAHIDRETQIAIAGGIYLFIRFIVADVIRRTTVHRGMWHSIPAALIAGGVAFYLCACDSLAPRLFKVVAVISGYMSHLVLDELYSLEDRSFGRIHVRRSFGTAMKLWGRRSLPNMATYGVLLIVMTFVVGDPIVQQYLGFADANDSHLSHDASHNAAADRQDQVAEEPSPIEERNDDVDQFGETLDRTDQYAPVGEALPWGVDRLDGHDGPDGQPTRFPSYPRPRNSLPYETPTFPGSVAVPFSPDVRATSPPSRGRY